MNKTEMSKALAGCTEMSQAAAGQAVDAIFNPNEGIIAEAMSNGERVTIGGFGTFQSRERKAGTARNPRTGETINVPAKNVPAFKAAKGLKDAVADS